MSIEFPLSSTLSSKQYLHDVQQLCADGQLNQPLSRTSHVTDGLSICNRYITSASICVHSTAVSIRCRLGASPATGLVGIKENALLSAYFDCISFIPLVCQRWGAHGYSFNIHAELVTEVSSWIRVECCHASCETLYVRLRS